MFLTIPTIDELKGSDIADLIEMLVKHTSEFHEEIKAEGNTLKSKEIRVLLNNIQAAIEAKKNIHRSAAGL